MFHSMNPTKLLIDNSSKLESPQAFSNPPSLMIVRLFPAEMRNGCQVRVADMHPG